MEGWYLSIIFGAILNVQGAASGAAATPVQLEKFGPMTQTECIAAATAINGATLRLHAQCESQIPGGVMIQGFGR
jgi:hypothetical protein